MQRANAPTYIVQSLLFRHNLKILKSQVAGWGEQDLTQLAVNFHYARAYLRNGSNAYISHAMENVSSGFPTI